MHRLLYLVWEEGRVKKISRRDFFRATIPIRLSEQKLDPQEQLFVWGHVRVFSPLYGIIRNEL